MMTRLNGAAIIAGCLVTGLASANEWRASNTYRLALGGVYVAQSGEPIYSVVELLGRAALSGHSAWVQSDKLPDPYVRTIDSASRVECINRRWCEVRWKVDLIGYEGSVESVYGIHELPEILNRPLTGSLSNRSEELRIAQMQQQASDAIAKCSDGQQVVVCIAVTTLKRARLRVQGYSSLKGVEVVASAYAKRLKVAVGAIEGPANDGSFLVDLDGEVVCEATLRTLCNSEPRFGRDRLFFFGSEQQAFISADGDSIRLLSTR